MVELGLSWGFDKTVCAKLHVTICRPICAHTLVRGHTAVLGLGVNTSSPGQTSSPDTRGNMQGSNLSSAIFVQGLSLGQII